MIIWRNDWIQLFGGGLICWLKIVVNFIFVVGIFSKYFVGNKLHTERERQQTNERWIENKRKERERENTNQINEYLSICISDLVFLIRNYLTWVRLEH